MAVDVTEDVVVGMRVRHNKQGYWAQRKLFVTGLDPTAPPGLVFGLTFFGKQIPDYNIAHPFLFGCYCYEIEAMPPSPTARGQLNIIASYGPAEMVGGWRVCISGSNGSKTLTLGNDGLPFQLKYTPLAGGGGLPVPTELVDVPTFQYLAPGSVVTFEREEFVSPWPKIQQIKSCTNSAAFLGQDPHHVLCRDVAAESFRGSSGFSGPLSAAWRVRYIFDVAPDRLGWNQVALFQDQYTGRTPVGPGGIDFTVTNGSKGQLILDPYEAQGRTYDFNSLGFPTI